MKTRNKIILKNDAGEKAYNNFKNRNPKETKFQGYISSTVPT